MLRLSILHPPLLNWVNAHASIYTEWMVKITTCVSEGYYTKGICAATIIFGLRINI